MAEQLTEHMVQPESIMNEPTSNIPQTPCDTREEPSTPKKSQSAKCPCDCDCECWRQDDYHSLAPRKAGYKQKSGTEEYVMSIACKHYASCHLSGTTCSS